MINTNIKKLCSTLLMYEKEFIKTIKNKICYLYKIHFVFRVENKQYHFSYVGKTSREVESRLQDHFTDLKNNCHCNNDMQDLYNKITNNLPPHDYFIFNEVVYSGSGALVAFLEKILIWYSILNSNGKPKLILKRDRKKIDSIITLLK